MFQEESRREWVRSVNRVAYECAVLQDRRTEPVRLRYVAVAAMMWWRARAGGAWTMWTCLLGAALVLPLVRCGPRYSSRIVDTQSGAIRGVSTFFRLYLKYNICIFLRGWQSYICIFFALLHRPMTIFIKVSQY